MFVGLLGKGSFAFLTVVQPFWRFFTTHPISCLMLSFLPHPVLRGFNSKMILNVSMASLHEPLRLTEWARSDTVQEEQGRWNPLLLYMRRTTWDKRWRKVKGFRGCTRPTLTWWLWMKTLMRPSAGSSKRLSPSVGNINGFQSPGSTEDFIVSVIIMIMLPVMFILCSLHATSHFNSLLSFTHGFLCSGIRRRQ